MRSVQLFLAEPFGINRNAGPCAGFEPSLSAISAVSQNPASSAASGGLASSAWPPASTERGAI